MLPSSSVKPTRLLFYCEHPILALGLTSILGDQSDFQIEITSSRDEALTVVESASPEMVLLDMNADFHLGFLQAIRKVSREAKLVLWVDSISTEMAFQAFNLGVRGVLRKLLPPSAFLTQLRNIRDGNLWIEKTLMNSIVSAKAVQLTRREAQLVALLAQALKNKEIAATMNVTENTVKAYLSRLFQKLGVKDRLELALYGLKNMNGTMRPDQNELQFVSNKESGAVAFQSILVPQQRVTTFVD